MIGMKLTKKNLFLIIFLAVFLAGGLLFLSIKAYLVYEAEQLAQELQAELEAAARKADLELRQREFLAKIEAERRQKEIASAARARADKIAAELKEAERVRIKQESIRRQLNQTCAFWRGAYRKSGKDYDRMMRDSACAR